MLLNMYSVFDSASGIYDRPFFAVSDGAALRSFGDICLDAEHPIGKHPEHYSLFHCGSFNDNDCCFNLVDRTCLSTGLECVAQSRTVDKGAQLDLVKEIADAS